MPRVSILIGVYNGQKTLEQSLSSIFAQTFKDFEVIAVDDASTDTTPNILERFAVKYPNVFIIEWNASNQGLTKSLNKALKKARGEYIARINADDSWEPTKLEKQVTFLDAHPEIGIIGTNCLVHYEGNSTPKRAVFPETHKEIARKLFRRNPFAHSAILARTALLQNAGGYDESVRYGQDYELWLRLFPKTKLHNLQEFLCTRTVSDGISVAKQNAQMKQSIKTRFKYIRKYRYGLMSYLYLLEPLAVILTPTCIKDLKRRYL